MNSIAIESGRLLKVLLFILLYSAFTLPAYSQPCLPDGISFSTQSQIDSFSINYPNCTGILGDVRIRSLPANEIQNLDGLNALIAIGGDLTIECNANLQSLSGLDNLVSVVGSLEIYLNNFDGLTGLDNLNYVGGDLIISNCHGIKNFEGLNNLSTVGGKLSIYENSSLTNFTGLDNLVAIGGNLTIVNHHSLVNFIGLENLKSIGGWLYIHNNYNLKSLSGLDNISSASIMDIDIISNPSLSNCHINSVCGYLVSPNGYTRIEDNAEGCGSPEEIQDSCAAHSFSIKEQNIIENILISPNPFTTSTTISYALEKPEDVQFTVYNVQSQIVFMMLEEQDKGEQKIEWNAEGLPGGMYYYRIQAGDKVGGGKLVVGG